jgi:hypothetical protein
MTLDTIAELQDKYRAELEGDELTESSGLLEHDIQRWSAQLGVTRTTLYDEIALFLAHGFHKRELSYAFCANIINDLWTLIRLAEEAPPDVFWSVYLAFDEGEYERRVGEDPTETYTRPLIAEIVDLHPAR